MGRQENICADHTAFVGVVADLTVVFAEQLFSSTVGGAGHSRLSSTPFNLGDVEMEQGQSITLLLVNGLVHQSGNFRQEKDLLHQAEKSFLTQIADLRGNTFYRAATGD